MRFPGFQADQSGLSIAGRGPLGISDATAPAIESWFNAQARPAVDALLKEVGGYQTMQFQVPCRLARVDNRLQAV